MRLCCVQTIVYYYFCSLPIFFHSGKFNPCAVQRMRERCKELHPFISHYKSQTWRRWKKRNENIATKRRKKKEEENSGHQTIFVILLVIRRKQHKKYKKEQISFQKCTCIIIFAVDVAARVWYEQTSSTTPYTEYIYIFLSLVSSTSNSSSYLCGAYEF